MKIGLKLPNSGPFATAQAIRAVALEAERLGYDSLWVHDHIHRTLEQARSHSAGGSLAAWDTWDEPQRPNMFEAVTTLSYVAGLTENITLGAGVIVLPLRNPVWLAKYFACLDQFSGGRTILGVGSGGGPYIAAELKAAGLAHLVGKRGKVVDEWLDVIQRVFSDPIVNYEGELIQVEGGEIFPKPIQQPLPIWYGGSGPRAMERIASRLQGWFLRGWTSPSLVAQDCARMAEMVVKHGREPSEIAICSSNWLAVDADHARAVERGMKVHKNLTDYVTATGTADTREMLEAQFVMAGCPDDLLEKLADYQHHGVDHLILRPIADDLPHLLEQLQMFKESVRDRLPAPVQSG